MGVAGRTGSLASKIKKTRIQHPSPEFSNPPRTRHSLHLLAVTSSRHWLSLVRGTHKIHKGRDEPAQTDEG